MTQKIYLKKENLKICSSSKPNEERPIMSSKPREKSVGTHFLSKIKTETKVVSNVCFILDKLERDGQLLSIKEVLNTTILNEIVYAVGQLIKMEKKSPALDLKTQLINNTYIFKENLKLICSFVGSLISRANLERKAPRRFDFDHDLRRGQKDQARPHRRNPRGKRVSERVSGGTLLLRCNAQQKAFSSRRSISPTLVFFQQQRKKRQ